jgi:HK97 family phage major capsid protein
MNIETRKLKALTRAAVAEIEPANAESRAAKSFVREVGSDEEYDAEISFSSEAPVDRWFGREILDHDPDSINLERAKSGALVGVFNHDVDRLVWRVTKVMIGKDKRAYARIKWGVSDDAKKIRAEVEAGTLRNISFIYRIHELELEHKNEDTGERTYRSKNWEVLSIDPVTIPADHGIGFGRDLPSFPTRILGGEFPDDPEQTPATNNQEPAQPENRSVAIMSEPVKTPAVDPAELNAKLEAARKEGEAKADLAMRVYGSAASAAEDLGAEIMKRAEEHVAAGKSADEWYRFIQGELQKKNKHIEGSDPTKLDMSPGDQKRYSIRNALLLLAGDPQAKDGIEREAHEAQIKNGAKVNAEAARSILIPSDILKRSVGVERRDQTVSTLSGGGYLVQNQYMPMIDLLRAKTIIDKLGVRRLDDAVGFVTMPRKTGSATIAWLGSETSSPSEGSMTFGLLTATPHTAGAYIDVTRNLLLQASGTAEAIATEDLAYGAALIEDYATLSGSGAAGQPRGLRNVSGIGSVTFSSSLDLGDILEAELDLADAHVDTTSAKFLAATNVRKFAKTNVAFASTASPLWDKDGTMNGYATLATSNTTAWPAGNLAFGKWDEILNVYWGGLEIATDQSAGFLNGTLRVRVLRTMDVMVLQTGAFTIETSITA